MKRLAIFGIFVLTLSSCDFLNFADKANSKFADQHFKTAISQIELYHLRYGHYPETLERLDFLGDWDKLIYSSVDYERLDTGYRLDVVMGIIKGKPSNLNYPKEFWQGLGIKQSNLLNSPL